jgi:hypothetical protein
MFEVFHMKPSWFNQLCTKELLMKNLSNLICTYLRLLLLQRLLQKLLNQRFLSGVSLPLQRLITMT